MSDLSTFFESSPIARNTRPYACVVLKRAKMSAAALVRLKEAGSYDAGSMDTRACELEVGGQVVARGKIVRRWGKSFLKILETDIKPIEEAGEEK